MSPWQRWWLLAFGVVWTLPNSLIGAIAGVVAMPFGARPKFHKGDLALVFHGFPLGPGGAMTLGNVMLSTHTDLETLCTTYAHRAGWCVQPKTRIGDHERAHVLQYMALGPLFLPLYLLFGGVSVRNCFERAADRYALTGRGWWPWLKVNSKAAIVRIGDTRTR
ncbi:MAG: hypothetical protein HOP03_17790 [Lysobacter sp.]|nr:hypothetical protein [Lysobacter sp.]